MLNENEDFVQKAPMGRTIYICNKMVTMFPDTSMEWVS